MREPRRKAVKLETIQGRKGSLTYYFWLSIAYIIHISLTGCYEVNKNQRSRLSRLEIWVVLIISQLLGLKVEQMK